MKYKLLKDLPFMETGTIFGTGCWGGNNVGGGKFGVDLGETHYESGGSSHNGIRTFEKFEDKLLEGLLDNKKWIEKIPTSEYEVLDLYDKKEIDRSKLLELFANLKDN